MIKTKQTSNMNHLHELSTEKGAKISDKSPDFTTMI